MPDLYARALQHPGTPWVNAASGLADPRRICSDRLPAESCSWRIWRPSAASSRRTFAFIAARGERQKLRIVSFTAEDPRRLADERGFDPTLLAQLSQLVLIASRAGASTRGHPPELAAMLLAQYVEARFCPPREFSRRRSTCCATSRGRATSRSCSRSCAARRSRAAHDVMVSSDGSGAACRRPIPVAAAASARPPLREAREAFERGVLRAPSGADGGGGID